MSHRQQEYTFSQVPRADIPRSNFRRSHGHKTTFDSGRLVPFYVDEVLPGDTFNVRASIFARLATPVVPVMDNMYLDVFFFAVPNRLVWDNWQKFCGEQVNPGDSTDYLIPQVDAGAGGFANGSLFDYMGCPTGVPNLKPSALFARAYNLIWNEWFRDENLQNSLLVPKGDGPDSQVVFDVMQRGKRHDYFTSCLPWPQKGPGVEIALGATAPVIAKPGANVGKVPNFAYDADSGFGAGALWKNGGGSSSNVFVAGDKVNTVNASLRWDDNLPTGLVTDLSAATAVTINSLRQAFQLQKLQERDARGGTRYREILQSHFGVTSPDARLQRPEFLGGGTIPININPVAQTSATVAGTTPIGKLAGFGTAGGSGLGFTKSFVEHCVIIGLINARADLTYQQGMPRMFSRRTKYDFYWPALAHIGEQAVLSKEIYCDGSADDELVFGYQERWAEYRYMPSRVSGKFRSNTPGGALDYWHLALNFTARPNLNASFIRDAPPVGRVIAVVSEPQFIMDSFLDIQTARPMPVYSVPGLIDHF